MPGQRQPIPRFIVGQFASLDKAESSVEVRCNMIAWADRQIDTPTLRILLPEHTDDRTQRGAPVSSSLIPGIDEQVIDPAAIITPPLMNQREKPDDLLIGIDAEGRHRRTTGFDICLGERQSHRRGRAGDERQFSGETVRSSAARQLSLVIARTVTMGASRSLGGHCPDSCAT